MASFAAADAASDNSDAVAPRDSSADAPTSVARLNATIKDAVGKWGQVWVEGELTDWKIRQGSIFGRLKDPRSDSTISITVWSSVRARIPEDLDVGDHVVACVKSDYWPKNGSLSFIVSAMKHVGLGDQLAKLEQLRAQLAKEGLFDLARKKPLPFLPNVIGLITGEKSDAEKDVLRNAQLRWPHVRFRTIYTAVQGERSPGEVRAALLELDADEEVDVIIIARGGGDPQTLLGFSDEALVRAVAAANTPVVSAIGHENDHPILDDVADLRASTPTDAAKRVVPDVTEQRAIVGQLRSRAFTRVNHLVTANLSVLEQLRSRPALRNTDALIAPRAQEVYLAVARGREALARDLTRRERVIGELAASVRALSPAATLQRGYAIVQQTQSGALVRTPEDAPIGTSLTITVEGGKLGAKVE